MNTKKMLGLAAAAVAALGMSASSASAIVTSPDALHNHQVTGTATSPVTLGTFVTCTSSSVVGNITSNEDRVDRVGTGVGGGGPITGASFTGGCTVAVNGLPWQLDGHPTSATTNAVHIRGVNVTVTVFGVNCTYAGTVNGTHNETTQVLTLSGSLTKTAGGFLCPNSGAVNGTYAIRADGDNDADNLASTNPVPLLIS